MENYTFGEHEPRKDGPVQFVAHEFVLPRLTPDEYNELFSTELAIIENLMDSRQMDGVLQYIHQDMLGEVRGAGEGKLRHGYEVAADILQEDTWRQFDAALNDKRFSMPLGTDLREGFRAASEKIAEIAELVSMIAASSRGLSGPYKDEIATLILRSERLTASEQLCLIEEAARHLYWQ